MGTNEGEVMLRRRRKLFCKRGHPRTEENVYKNDNCRICAIERVSDKWRTDPIWREKKLISSRKYQKSLRWKELMLKRDYGLSLNDYQEMHRKQNGCCLICGIAEDKLTRPLNVDHNHTTNKVRGLLCCNCNTAIGLFKENKELIQKAVEYLKVSCV